MKANPQKFQLIWFGKDNKSTLTLLPGVTLESIKVVKLLGIQIDFQLKFDEHVSVLCSKTSRQINVLARLSRTLDQNGKLKIMQSCILCYFNYCPVVWHYCSKDSILKMEKIQCRALKYVYIDYKSSYVDLLERANIKFLFIQRQRDLLMELFKTYNKQGPSYLHDFFCFY